MFQFVTKSWRELAWAFVIITILATLYVIIFVPESVQWLHSVERFEESRKGLTSVAHQNFVYKLEGKPYENFKFVREISLEKKQQMMS